MKDRILCILLVAVLLLNSLPLPALGIQNQEENGQTVTQDVVLNDTLQAEPEEEEPADEGWSWELNGTVLTIRGKGPMDDFAAKGPWSNTITEAIIEPGITTIGNYAFYGCKSLTKVTIPDTVKDIRTSAFGGCNALQEMVIPGSVTSIGDYAFSGCNVLPEIVIPDSVITVGEYAFSNCKAATSITIGEGVTSVGDYAFYGCAAFTTLNYNAIHCSTMDNTYSVFQNCSQFTTLNVGNQVTSIPKRGFYGCTTLTNIDFGSSVSVIGEAAFYNCKGLTELSLPEGLTVIGKDAFNGCSGLQTVSLPDSLCEVGNYAFYLCTMATTTYGNANYLGNAENPYVALVSATSTSVTSVNIHPDTVLILNHAFDSCANLTELTLPDSVRFIGYRAFYKCTKLAKVSLGTGLKAIDSDAFYYCNALNTVDVPNLEAWCGIEFANFYANPACRSGALYVGGQQLTDMVIPDSVKTIYPYAFYNQKQIISVTIPESVTAIGTYAFAYTGITSVRIPQGVTELSASVFSSCEKLTQVVLHDGITAIENDAFSGCTGLTQITLSKNLQSLGEDVFYGCTGLTELVIPDGVTEVSQGALAGLSNLQSLTVPFASISKPDTDTNFKIYHPFGYFFGLSSFSNSVSVTQYEHKVYATSGVLSSTTGHAYYLPAGLKEVTMTGEEVAIGTFENCTGLIKVTLPNAIHIGDDAFKNCTGLTTVDIAKNLKSLGKNAFTGCSKLSQTIYENGRYFGSAENPYAILLGVVSSSATSFRTHEDTVFIAENALSMYSSLTSLTITDGVTQIGEYAFRGCSGLTSLVIPTSVKSIGKNAFASCTKLQTLTTPCASPSNGTLFLHFFGNDSSSLPASLTKVTITAGEIPDNAFSGLSQLKTIIISEGVTYIGTKAFYGCTGLTGVGIPGTVTIIGDNAFENCSNLTAIAISDGVESICKQAFRYCSKLTALTIPDSVTYLGNYVFESCTGLKTVELGSGLEKIGQDIFKGSSIISNMTFGKMDQALTYYFDLTASSIPVDTVTIKSGIVPANAFNGSTKLAIVNLKEGVTAIGDGAFSGCTTLKTISIPASVTTIGASAFYGCTALKTVSLKDGLKTIRNQAFRGCSALTAISIPSSVTTIEASVFTDCSSLTYHVDGVAKYLGNTDNPKHVLAAVTDKTITSFQISEDTGIILDDVFKNATKLTTVSVPATVTSIGSSAFYSCSALTAITIPEGVTDIWSNTFYGCKKLTQITIPASITHIGLNAFQNCSGLTRVNITDLAAWCGIDFESHTANPVYLGKNLYVNGSLLTRLVVPASVKTLCSSTFAGCTSLTEVVIPDTVETIEGSAFACCSNLQSMTIPFLGMHNSTTGRYPQYPFGYLFGSTNFTGGTSASQPYYNSVSTTTSSTYYIPNSLTSVKVTGGDITYGAFFGCKKLTSIDVSATESGIAGRAFYNCEALTDLKLPSNINKVGTYAFHACLKLTEITLPDTVTTIEDYAFMNCTGLKKVNLGNSVETIGNYAFSTCNSLTELTIPDSVNSIGTGILTKCAKMQSLTIPFTGDSRKTAEDTYQYPLGYLFGTTSYTGGTLTKQYYYGSSKTSTTYSNYYIPSSLTTVTVTDGNLNYGAFYGCSSITEIHLGDGVLNVTPDAFIDTNNLEAIEVTEGNPNYSSLYRILYNKDKTQVIWKPAKHTYILTVNFIYADGKPVYDTVVQRLKNGASYSVAVPELLGYSAKFDSVAGAMPEQDLVVDVIYYENEKLTGGSCTDTITWTLYDDGSLIFRGTGAMPDYTSGSAPWAEYADDVLCVYMDSRITKIGAYAFENCVNLKFVDYGYGVSSIGAYAFAGCTGLTSFKLPESVTTIADGAFYGCNGLKSVNIPDNITSVGAEAFRGCSTLVQVTVGGNVTSIGDNAFADCGALTQVYFRGEPVTLGSNGLGSAAGKFVYYYSTVDGWTDVITDGLWNGYTAVPYNAIAKENFDGTNVYIIKVVDRYNTPLVGAVVMLGDEVMSTNNDGMVYFVKPTEPQKLTVSCSNHITFEDAAFVATTTQVMDIIELSDRPSVVQGVSMNGQSIATTVAVLNCSGEETVTIAVTGYSKYTIIKYELHQGDRLIATVNTSDAACTFRVKANAFEEGETVLVRMYTADGYMVATALNIDVIKLADIAQQQIIDEMSDLDLDIGLGDLGLIELNLPVEFRGVENLYTKIDGRTIYVGINININDMLERKDPIKEIKEAIQKSIKPELSLTPKVEFKLAGYLEIEYLGNDEYYIKTSYVKLSVALSLEGEAGASFYGIVGINCKVTVGAESSLEVYITRFTPEDGFHLGELNFIQDIFMGLEIEAFILWRAGSATAYGNTRISVTLGIIPELAWKQVVITGEIGVKWSALWGLFSGEKVLASGEIYRWPSENVMLAQVLWSAMRDPNAYESNDRGYLENRTEWQGDGEYLQQNIYDNVAPKIVKCGDTTMMLWLDDNSQRENGDFQTLYYSVYTNGTWSAPVAVDDNGTFDCEFDVCTDGDKIYVVYTELKAKQPGVETLDMADQSGIDAFINGVEVAVAVYENGSFGAVTRLTDNSVCELLPTVAVIEGVPTITWVESNAVGLETQTADSKLCTVELTNTGWSDPSDLIGGQNAISDVATVVLQNKVYTAYIADGDGNDETADDMVLILRSEDGQQLQVDSGVISEVNAAVVAEQQVMIWSNNGKIYMITDAEQTPICLMPENVNAASKFQIVSLSDEETLLLFAAANDADDQSGTDIYSAYINAEGCMTSAVQIADTEGYVAGYSASYQEEKLVIVFTETIATVSGGNVETVSHLRTAAVEFYTDLVIENVEYDISTAQPNTQMVFTFYLRNGGTNAIDGFEMNFYDKSGALLYTADQTLLLASGAAAECQVTVVLPQNISEDGYRIELLPKYGMAEANDATPADNSVDLELAFADIQIEAEQKVIGEKNYIIVSVANGGNVASDAWLQIFAADGSGRLISEIGTGVIAPGTAEQYMVDIHALTTKEDTAVLCVVTPTVNDPVELNNKDVVRLFHIAGDTFVKDPEQIIRNPELSATMAEFDKYIPENIVVQITAEGEYFEMIESLTEGTDYTVADDGTITISRNYLSGLENGSHTLKLVFDFGYGDPIIRNFTITVKNSAPVTITGNVAITGNPVVDGTVRADISGLLPGSANVAYSWSVDGQIVGTERSYTATSQDYGKELTLTVTGINGYEGTFTAVVTIGLYQPKAPNLPMIAKVEADSITVVQVAGLEYSLDGDTWQTETAFTGLLPNKNYTVYARVKATDTSLASEISQGTNVTTLKLTARQPAAPVMVSRTPTQIVLEADPTLEYKIEGGQWTSNNVFTDLNPDTEYVFYQRYKETDTTYASEASAASFRTMAGVTVSGNVTGYTDGEAVIQLMQGEIQVASAVTINGVYTLPLVSPGTYSLVVTKLHHLTVTCEITVMGADIQQNVTMRLLGDADSNGQVTADDAALLKQYRAGLVEENGLDLEACDLNANGKVDAYDAYLVQLFVAGRIDQFPCEG